MNRPLALSPWAVAGLHLFAVILVLSPLVDLASTVWPARPGDFTWRYGFLGLAAGYLHTPMLGLVLSMAIALWQGRAGLLRVLGALSLFAAVLLVLAMGVFALDVVQMRAMRAEEMRSMVAAGGALQELKYLGAFLVCGLLGIGAWKTAGELPARGDRREEAAGIVASVRG